MAFNVIGTTFYGKRRFGKDGSYVTTKWFVFACFPIVPLGSLRLRQFASGFFHYRWPEIYLATPDPFDVLEELPMDWMQVLSTYVYAIFIVGWVAYFSTNRMPVIGKYAMIFGGIAIPYVLRFFAKRRQAGP